MALKPVPVGTVAFPLAGRKPVLAACPEELVAAEEVGGAPVCVSVTTRMTVRVEVWVVMLVALMESWEWETVSLAQAEAVRARPRMSVGRVNLIVVAGVGLRGMRID